MNIARSKDEVKRAVQKWHAQGLKTGFVPTMGALHEGHLSLVDIAAANAQKTISSIFVNPTQFAPHEDFEAYPREEKRDLAKLEARGVDLVYLPSVEDIYPDGLSFSSTEETALSAAEGLESDFRPHFFGGVVNVVSRLFEQVEPDLAVFGEKDYQQLMVIREMVETRNIDIKILGGPVVRDEAGLALSSRNAYLNKDELQIARQLNKVLKEAAMSLRTPRDNPEKPDESGILATAEEKLLHTGFDRADYVASRWDRILGAAWIGKTRLIDNVPLRD